MIDRNQIEVVSDEIIELVLQRGEYSIGLNGEVTRLISSLIVEEKVSK